MRKLLLLCVFTIPLLTAGCANDDPPPPTYIEDNTTGDVILFDEYGNPI